MEVLLLLLLVVSAAALYLPGIIRERALDSPLDTVSDFRRRMNALATSTNHTEPGTKGYAMASTPGQNESEPYVRRNNFPDSDFEEEDELIPYPSNRSARVEMETKRQRIMVSLWIVTLATGILILVPNLRWLIPLHITILVLLAAYSLLVILLPYYYRNR